MPRTILVHLNIEVPDDDDRTAEDLSQTIVDTLALDPDVIHCTIVAPLAEEIES